ncbi:MAG TPA: ribosome maturation factor RimP [Bryobacteraceae bacterium]|nr:ribosome maturation factor RimP [Bryobacteraceae bacterium]
MPHSITREAIVAKVVEITDRVGRPEHIEAVEAEFLGGGNNRLLRIYIDKPGGITHADCEFISQHVGTILDVEDVIPGGSYTLEVSSPGVERRLMKPSDYERFRGQKIKVSLREPVENQKRWEGTLTGFSDGFVTLEPAPGKTVRFALAQVQKANLKFEW